MRIYDSNLTGTSAAGGPQETQRGGRTGGARAAGGPDSDRVELSDRAGSIARAIVADAGGHASRVARLATEYQSGRYEPDAAETSRAMVGEALASA